MVLRIHPSNIDEIIIVRCVNSDLSLIIVNNDLICIILHGDVRLLDPFGCVSGDVMIDLVACSRT